MADTDLLHHIKKLEAENASLRSERDRLLDNIHRLEAEIFLPESLRAESFVARLVSGLLSVRNASIDILSGSGRKLEVKFSKLGFADLRRTIKTKRWAWSKPFGESGNKRYDRLILIGLKDERFDYLDPLSPFVIFDVPYGEIFPLTINTNRGKYRSIHLTTNPNTAKSRASPLFKKYQITERDLEARYRHACRRVMRTRSLTVQSSGPAEAGR